MKNYKNIIKRGDVYLANLNPVIGSEQGGFRPVIIISNESCNRFSPNVICAAITSKTDFSGLPTHINIKHSFVSGVLLAEQIRTISLKRLCKKLGHIDDMSAIDIAIKKSLALN